MKPDPATLCLLFAIGFIACLLAGGIAIYRMSGLGFVSSWLAALAAFCGMLFYGRRAQ